MKKKIINKKGTKPLVLKPKGGLSPFCEMCTEREISNNHHVGINKKDREKRNIHLENLDKKELGIYKRLAKKALKENPEDPKFDMCVLCHAKIHNIEPKRSELKDRVVLLNRNQKTRIVIDNQIKGFGRIEMKVPKYYLEIKETLLKEEKKLVKDIKMILEGKGDQYDTANTHGRNVSPFPIYKWLKNVRGIGPLNSAYLIAYIDWEKTPSVSALWCYCGQTPDSKRKKGQKENWNPILKQRCFNISESFIKSKSPYKKIYDKEKQKQLDLMENDHAGVAKTPDTHVIPSIPKSKETINHLPKPNEKMSPSIPKSRMHAHKRAMRKMVKLFLKDMWVEWNHIQKKETTKNVLIPITKMSPSNDKLKKKNV